MDKIKNKFIIITNESKKYFKDIFYILNKIGINNKDIYYIIYNKDKSIFFKKYKNLIYVNTLKDIICLDKTNIIVGYGRGLGGVPFDQLGYFLSKFKKKIRIHDGINIKMNNININNYDFGISYIELFIIYYRFYGLFNLLKIILFKIKNIDVDKYFKLKDYGVLEINKIIENEK